MLEVASVTLVNVTPPAPVISRRPALVDQTVAAADVSVKAPAAVVKLEAVAAVTATPAEESIVVAAELISKAPVVVISISPALPAILTPAAPLRVRAPAPVDHVDAAAPVNVRAPAAVVKLEAVAAVTATPAEESIVVAAALISKAPVVVISISPALPAILTPVSYTHLTLPTILLV